MIFLSLHLGKQQARDMIHSTCSDIFDTSLNKIFVHDLSFSLISNISNFLEKNQIIIINKTFSIILNLLLLLHVNISVFKIILAFLQWEIQKLLSYQFNVSDKIFARNDFYPSVSIRCHSWNEPRNLSHTVTKNRFSQ